MPLCLQAHVLAESGGHIWLGALLHGVPQKYIWYLKVEIQLRSDETENTGIAGLVYIGN